MIECTTHECENVAQMTVTKTVANGLGGTLDRRLEVCRDCGPEMVALYGWEVVPLPGKFGVAYKNGDVIEFKTEEVI